MRKKSCPVVVLVLLLTAPGLESKAVVHKVISQSDQAMRDLNRAIELDPKDSSLYESRAFLRKSIGDLLGAIQDYTTAIELDPSNASYFRLRAEVRKIRGDTNGAIEDRTKQIELAGKRDGYPWNDPNHPDSLVQGLLERAELRYKKGDVPGAIQDVSKALEVYPDVHYECVAHWTPSQSYRGVFSCTAVLGELRKKAPSTPATDGARARTIMVAQDGSGDYRNVTSALLRASPGDVIQIRPGSYEEWITIGQAQEGLTIAGSGNDPSKVSIRELSVSGSKARIRNVAVIQQVSIWSAQDVALENLQIGRGVKRTLEKGIDRGGVNISQSENVLVKNCTISASDVGIRVESSTGIKLEKNLITQNNRGVIIEGHGFGHDQVTLENNTIVRNLAGTVGVAEINATDKRLDEAAKALGGSHASDSPELEGVGIYIEGDGLEAILYNNLVAFNDLGIAVFGAKNHDDKTAAKLPANFDGKDANLPTCRLENNDSFGNRTRNNSPKWLQEWRYTGQDGKDYVVITQHSFKDLPEGKSLAIGGKRCCMFDLVALGPRVSNSNWSVNPLFVDEAKGDYRLRPGSPLATKGMGGTYIGAFPSAGDQFK